MTLIRHMPEDSATLAALRGGPEHRPWTLQTDLLAGIFNAVAAANWQRTGKKSGKPEPVKPPEIKNVAGKKKKGTMSLRQWRDDQRRAAMHRMKEKAERRPD